MGEAGARRQATPKRKRCSTAFASVGATRFDVTWTTPPAKRNGFAAA